MRDLVVTALTTAPTQNRLQQRCKLQRKVATPDARVRCWPWTQCTVGVGGYSAFKTLTAVGTPAKACSACHVVKHRPEHERLDTAALECLARMLGLLSTLSWRRRPYLTLSHVIVIAALGAHWKAKRMEAGAGCTVATEAGVQPHGTRCPC